MLASLLESAATTPANSVVCDTVEPLASFDASRYMGTWYNIQHSHGAAFQPDNFDCTQAVYSNLDQDAGTFEVYNSSTVGFLPRTGVHGNATCAGTPTGQCIVSFFGQQFDHANYLVVDTDYDTYSMVYACEPDDMQFLWILSRTPKMDQDLLDRLNAEAMEKLPNYDWSIVRHDKQGDGCRYLESETKPF